MIAERCAPTTGHVVVRFGRMCSAGLSRAALKGRWSILSADEPGLMRSVMIARPRMIAVQLDEQGLEPALRLIHKLATHWNPVRALVIGPVSGSEFEVLARQAGAAAYLAASADENRVVALADAIESGYSGTAIANSFEPSGISPERSRKLVRVTPA